MKENSSKIGKKPSNKHYRFFFHYNKPEAQRAKRPRISLHHKNTCHIIDNIQVLVPTEGKINKRQPYFVMQGWAKNVEIKNGIATVT